MCTRQTLRGYGTSGRIQPNMHIRYGESRGRESNP